MFRRLHNYFAGPRSRLKRGSFQGRETGEDEAGASGEDVEEVR